MAKQMEQREISFETAKLAKEKGLEDGLRCTGLYCIGYDSISPDENLMKLNYFRNSVKGQFHLALAPAQSLLQKWLREIHKIEVEISYNFCPDTNNDLGYGVSLMSDIDDVKKLKWYGLDITGTWYKTYEEALEDGLKEGLKLIQKTVTL